jgi:hypothetical protein
MKFNEIMKLNEIMKFTVNLVLFKCNKMQSIFSITVHCSSFIVH